MQISVYSPEPPALEYSAAEAAWLFFAGPQLGGSCAHFPQCDGRDYLCSVGRSSCALGCAGANREAGADREADANTDVDGKRDADGRTAAREPWRGARGARREVDARVNDRQCGRWADCAD